MWRLVCIVTAVSLPSFGESSPKLRTFPDVALDTGGGIVTLTSLAVKRGGMMSATRLTGVLVNNTVHDWSSLKLKVNPSDGNGTNFGISAPILFPSIRAGASSPFYFDLAGRFDFPSLNYTFAISGSYKPQYKFRLVSPSDSDKLQFSDEYVDISLTPAESAIGFEIVNKTNAVIRLDWNQASFVDETGIARKVVGAQTRYIEINSPRPPTSIPPGSRISEMYLPTHLVHYSSSWIVDPLLPSCPDCKAYQGKQMRMYFPLEVNGKQRDYSLAFKVESAK